MKNILIALTVLLFLSTSESFSAGPFSLESSDLNIGIGLGSNLYGDVAIPPITASYEIGFPWVKNSFTKNISLGGYAGFARTEWNYPYWGTYSYTNIIIGARGSYHFYNEGDVDAYGGLMLGYNIFSASFEGQSGVSDPGYSSAAGGLTESIFVGARYYFSPSFGVYGELGYGIAYLSLGVTFKL